MKDCFIFFHKWEYYTPYKTIRLCKKCGRTENYCGEAGIWGWCDYEDFIKYRDEEIAQYKQDQEGRKKALEQRAGK